jgi:hypothetical protein
MASKTEKLSNKPSKFKGPMVMAIKAKENAFVKLNIM